MNRTITEHICIKDTSNFVFQFFQPHYEEGDLVIIKGKPSQEEIAECPELYNNGEDKLRQVYWNCGWFNLNEDEYKQFYQTYEEYHNILY